jgi:hypothetical protein
MKSNFIRIIPLMAIACLFCYITTAQGQAKGKSEITVDLSYFKKADNSRYAIALIKKNEDGKFVFAKNTKVDFYAVHDKQQELLKSVNTDNHGKAVIQILKDLPLDDSLYFTILAKIENNELYEDANDQVHHKDANLAMTLDPLDTSRLVTAKVTETGKNGEIKPVIGAEVKFYVQRLFGLMPVAEENGVVTDEKGEASFSYPKMMPGDTAGIITLAARIEGNEHFGNLENKTTQSWGAILPIIKEPFPRALFEPHAPLPLVITISTLFGGVWLVYFFVFYQMRKIKEEVKPAVTNSSPVT